METGFVSAVLELVWVLAHGQLTRAQFSDTEIFAFTLMAIFFGNELTNYFWVILTSDLIILILVLVFCVIIKIIICPSPYFITISFTNY